MPFVAGPNFEGRLSACADAAKVIGMLLLLAAASCRESRPPEPAPVDPAIAAHLSALVDAHDYFALRAAVDANTGKLDAAQETYFRAFVQSAFNRCRESIAGIEALLAGKYAWPSDASHVELLLLLRDNYFKTFQYAKAAGVGRDVLGRYRSVLGDRVHDVENTLLIHDGLATTPPQTVDLAPTSVTWTRNRLGLIQIPITVGTVHVPIVFDTRAHISTVTRSFAKKLGLRLLDVSYEESSGITGKTFRSGLGIADRLQIGDVVVRHAVFQVLPDEQLHFHFPGTDFTLDGILGFQVLTQLGEVHIFKDGRFTISPADRSDDLRNLAFDGSTTVLSVMKGPDALSFHFDTGAASSEFYTAYFEKYKASVLQDGTRQTADIGGVGGSTRVDVYEVPSIELTIGDRRVVLRDVSVRTVPAFKGQRYYGNLGQDLIRQFDEMVLNFDSMFVRFK